MPFDGNGNYVLPTPSYPAIGGATISSTYRNTIDADLQTALSNCVTRDGQSPLTANLPTAGFKLTGLGAGNAAGNSVRYEQVCGTPKVRAVTAAQSIAENVAVTIIGTVETFDIGSGYNNATGVFTAPKAGYYRLHCGISLGATATGYTVLGAISTGASKYVSGLQSPTYGISADVDDLVYLGIGDTAYFTLLQYTTGAGTARLIAATTTIAFEGE